MKASELNNYAEDSIVKLERGQRVSYRLLNVKKDPIPENKGRLMIPFSLGVPSTDRVYDSNKDEWIDIACIDRVKPDGDVEFTVIEFLRSNAGYIDLSGDKPSDGKLYQYLETCNYNASNPNRSTDKPPIFERVDAEKTASEKSKLRKLRSEAVDIAVNLGVEQVRSIGMAISNVEGKEDAVVRDIVEEYAEKNPKEFLKLAKNKELDIEAIAKKASKMKIIVYSNKTQEFSLSDGSKVFKSDINSFGGSPYKQLASYLMTEGSELLESIKEMIKAKEKE